VAPLSLWLDSCGGRTSSDWVTEALNVKILNSRGRAIRAKRNYPKKGENSLDWDRPQSTLFL